jgi:hypothetical protein
MYKTSKNKLNHVILFILFISINEYILSIR